ncbi:MAG: HD domain-containing protein [Clostridia bacterium]|nr:HD domain-containing protein [Clostridia bacterium]
MKARDISGVSNSVFGKLRDEIGALRKRTQLERLEPYAKIIDEVFEKYNTDDNSRTMMFKLLRNPVEGTVTRRKHTYNCAEIAGEIADNFDWLNSDIVRVMARHHDIGHTFLGHSGEWWLSSIKDTYGMPNFVHNAIGARNLSIRYKAQDEIIERIQRENPNISKSALAAIKNDMWLIFDAINDHNGEKSEYSYAPDFSKKKEQYENELMGCYTKKGFDRTLIPATAEGSLMRLTDKISYIPFDLVDIFRNRCNMPKGKIDGTEYDFYAEYQKAFKELGMSDDSLDKLLACKTEEDYDNFAKEMQKIFIEDVKKNTKRNNIRMSPEVSKVMHRIRDINNKLMVNYTVMKEDHEQYVPALEGMMKSAGRFLTKTGIIDANNIEDSLIAKFYNDPKQTELLLDSAKNHELTYGFAKYISNITPEDFAFTIESCKKAFEETIKGEIDVARAVTTGSVDAVEIQAEGKKKERIESFIRDFEEILELTYEDSTMQRMMNPLSKNPIDQFKRKVWLDKASAKIKDRAISKLKEGSPKDGIIPFHEMVAMEIGAQYLASLNDYEWKKVYELYSNPSKETKESLARTYDSFDFRAESQKHKAWDNIQKLQSKEISNTEKKDNTSVFATIKNLWDLRKNNRETR